MIESVVYGGVGMNFIPSPKMDFVAGGMIFPSVRSWKARFFKEGVVVERGANARTTVAFWKGDLWGSGRKPYLLLVIFAACADVWVFAPLSICSSDCMLWRIG